MKTRRPLFFVLVFALTGLLSVGGALAKPADNHRRGTALAVTLGTQYGPIDTTTTGGHLNVAYNCGATYMSHVIWFKFTPSSNQTLTADTSGSSYDTMLAVFDGRTEVACNDDVTGSTRAQVSFSATAGTTYYFAVGAYGRNDGGSAFFKLSNS